MDWRLKALAFRALDLPGGARAHYFLQRHVTRTWPRPANTLNSLQNSARRVVEDYARHVDGTPASVLEVGAGRDLAVPLALRRLGVRRVIASDVDRLARLDLIQHAADRILVRPLRFGGWDDLEHFGISYRAPHRVTDATGDVDCSCSNEVLEHVPPDQLVTLLAALRVVTTRLTVHSIDYSDHYARSDSNVSRLNFLRYSDDEWRPSDYLRLFREAGFRIIEESCEQGAPIEGIAPEFHRYDPLDLFAIRGRIVAAPNGK